MRRSKLIVFLMLFAVLASSFIITSYADTQYTLTYHANNGTSDTVVDTSDSNAFTVLPATTFAPADSGSISWYNVFKEWNTSADGTGTSVSPGETYYPTSSIMTHVVTDFHLFAIWETVKVRTYTVTYMPNYPSDSSLSDPGIYTIDGPYPAGSGVTARASSPYAVPSGYSLAGWSRTADGYAEYYPGEVFSMPAENLVLYAVWTTKPVLNRGDHFAYMQGYPAGDFRPSNNMTRAEAVVMFCRLLTEEMEIGATYSSSYTDVAADAWYANEIGYMEQNGVLSTTDAHFRPDEQITRAEFADLACGFENLTSGAPNSFTDVPSTHPYYDQINYAVERGWLAGYPDGSFKPDNSILRSEVVTVVNRVLERYADVDFIDSNVGTLKQYSDLTNGHWAYYGIMEASNSHLFTKVDSDETWMSVFS